MFGKNPIRAPEKGDGSILQVQEIFPTVQGEGPHTGVPSVFIRLGGCNLVCSFCDTEFEEFISMTLDDILDTVEDLSDYSPLEGESKSASEAKRDWVRGRKKINTPHALSATFGLDSAAPPQGGSDYVRRNLIVITGGEPLRQNILPLCEALLAEGYRVQIETNGTVWRELPQAVEIVCSPKASNGRYHPLRPDMLARADVLKFIVSKSLHPYDTVPDYAQGRNAWLQPMDEYDAAKNTANLEHVWVLAERHGYKVSLQTHKLAGID